MQKFTPKPKNEKENSPKNYAVLDYIVNVSVKKELTNTSEVVWINNN
jgi:hypothetical protein